MREGGPAAWLVGMVGRIPVMNVMPLVDLGRQPAKATVGEPFKVSATVFREGHDKLSAEVVLTDPSGARRAPVRMVKHAEVPDLHEAWVTPDVEGAWSFEVQAWSDPLATWQHDAGIKIPAGVDTGTRVQLAEQGEVGPGGGPAGDLYVEIHVAAHPVFKRQGDDLHCTVTVPMTAAALGTTIEMPTLEADVVEGSEQVTDLETSFELDIRPGTQSGTEQVLRGRGVPGLRGGRGDLVVTIAVETPTRLDARQEELLHELAAIRGEESPEGSVKPGAKSVFGRLRDAFNH